MPDTLTDLRSAVIDGRCLNPIFRKTQLEQLHQTLTQNASEIKQSLLGDAVLDQRGIDTQLWLSMKLLVDAYKELDPEKERRDEYAVVGGRGSEHARQAVGAVVLRANATYPAFIFCLMSVLVPAIVAGNCVVVQIEETVLETPRLVLDIISRALDKDIFFYTSGGGEIIASMLAPCRAVLVSQTHQDQDPKSSFYSHIDSKSQAPVVAIVERDANLEFAAKYLVHARFELGGESQYAPDVVLLNEGVKRDFLSEVIKEAAALSGILASSKTPNQSKIAFKDVYREFETAVEAEKGVNVLFSGSEGRIVAEFEDRATVLLGQKIRGSWLAIHSVTSMDDAIDWTSRLDNISTAYVFAGLDAAKYITQFVDAPTCFINHIPANLLFNPMASRQNPITRQGSVLTTYTQDLFTTPKSIFIDASKARTFPDGLKVSTRSEDLGSFPLPSISLFKRATKRPDIGFFEQGIITGALMLLSSVAMGSFGFYYGAKMVQPFLVSGS